MTYIPTVRNRFNKPLYKHTRGAEKITDNRNPYWEGYLSDHDGGAAMIVGFDYAADTVDNIFHNLDVYMSDLIAAGLMGEGKDEIPSIDESIVFSDKELEDFSEEELLQMTPLTRAAKAFRDIIRDWVESERDSFIVGNIEGTAEDEYNKCVKLADEEGYENMIIRSYPDVLKNELQGGTDED